LRSMDDKIAHARDLRDKLGVTRPIYLDALDGACHRAYGSMPNMTWIFTRSGTPIYKSNWSDADSTKNALDYFLDVTRRRRSREKLAPFKVERLDYRDVNREAFYEGLERSGPTAVEEYDILYKAGVLSSVPDDD
ncbi:MAG: deiodinase-related protein, partial [Chloroflexota bacterium]